MGKNWLVNVLADIWRLIATNEQYDEITPATPPSSASRAVQPVATNNERAKETKTAGIFWSDGIWRMPFDVEL